MASNSNIIKKSKHSQVHKPVNPTFYKFQLQTTEVDFPMMLAVLDNSGASFSSRLEMLSNDYSSKISVVASASKVGCSQPTLEVTFRMKPEVTDKQQIQAMEQRNRLNNQGFDLSQMCMSFRIFHYEDTRKDLATISASLVNENGKELFTPDWEAFLESDKNFGDQQQLYDPNHHDYEGYIPLMNRSTSIRQYPAERQARGVLWRPTLAFLLQNNSFFPNGVLRFKVTIGKDLSQEYVVVPKSLLNWSATLLELLESGDLSDFTIRCGANEFKVHGIILSARSPVFRTMLTTQMQEMEKREVTIPDVEPDVMKLLLQFIYAPSVEPENLGFHKICELIKAADKYQVMELKDICFNFITEEINFDTIGALATMVHHHSPSKEVQKRVSDFVNKNYNSLRLMPDFKEVMRHCLDLFWGA